MIRWFLHAKIHGATVTEAEPSYRGSITLDRSLLLKSGILPGEKVLVVSRDQGHRLETYVIEGPPDSGVVCMNGPAAKLIKKGDQVIVMAFGMSEKPVAAKAVLVDEKNQFVEYLPGYDNDNLTWAEPLPGES